MRRLGQISPVDPREIWQSEARDFTPWLADNLQVLGSALGLQLELQSPEAPVGDFSLDILARDLNRDALVVVENQLESTDHDHLGKLLTYASGYDARTIIWLSAHFREEHRQALDWLNLRTDATAEFFGVAIEVIRVDESRPAVNFRLIATPNEWRKGKVGAVSGGVSPRGEAYREFFQQLIDELREEHRFTGARVALPQSWYGFASGFTGVSYAACFGQGNRVRIELYIDFGDEDENYRVFDGLGSQRERLEEEYGQEFSWERLEEARACRIAVYRPGTIDEADHLDEIRSWMVKHLLRFKQVLGPPLVELLK